MQYAGNELRAGNLTHEIAGGLTIDHSDPGDEDDVPEGELEDEEDIDETEDEGPVSDQDNPD